MARGRKEEVGVCMSSRCPLWSQCTSCTQIPHLSQQFFLFWGRLTSPGPVWYLCIHVLRLHQPRTGVTRLAKNLASVVRAKLCILPSIVAPESCCPTVDSTLHHYMGAQVSYSKKVRQYEGEGRIGREAYLLPYILPISLISPLTH